MRQRIVTIAVVVVAVGVMAVIIVAVIVVAVVVTDSGRPLPRIGGLQVAEIKGQDGLR